MNTSKRDSMEAVSDLSTQLKATTLSAQPPSSKDEHQRPNLTTIPSSILNTIFSHLLDIETVNTGKENVSYTHTLPSSGTLQFKASRSPFPVQTALFYINKTISTAALHYFYAQNLFIRLTLRTPDARHAKTTLADSGVLFSAAPPHMLEAVTGHAMDVELVERDSTQKRAVVMFPAQYLPRLVNFAERASRATQSWAATHKWVMMVRNSYDFAVSRLQGDVLEPFRFLGGFAGCVVSGVGLLPGYKEGLEASMTEGFTAAEWIATLTRMVDGADAARKKLDWKEATQQCHAAVIALTYGYLTHPEDLHSQNDAGEAFATAVQRLRRRCESGIGTSVLDRHGYARPHVRTPPLDLTPVSARDLLLAEQALSAALSLATNSPDPTANPWLATLPRDLVPPNSETWFSDSERGDCWFQLGLAHAALGEFLFAAGDMERAVRLMVQGGIGEERLAEAESVFEWVRGKIDWEVRPGGGLRRAALVARQVGREGQGRL